MLHIQIQSQKPLTQNYIYKSMVSMLEAHDPSSLVQVPSGPNQVSYACA